MANYKKASVMVIAQATGTQTITNNASAATLQFTESTDQINYASGASFFDGTTFTTPYTGFYQFNFSLSWGAGVVQTAGFVVVQKMNPFSTVAYLLNGAAGDGAIQNVSRVVRLTKGDQITLLCSQTTGDDRTPYASYTTLSIIRVGNAS
jgi:ribosomal protein L18E